MSLLNYRALLVSTGKGGHVMLPIIKLRLHIYVATIEEIMLTSLETILINSATDVK